MGRKANPKTNKTGFGKASESIAKAFGDGVVINGQHIIEHPPEIISVSPALDAALGGGFIVGSMVTIAGHPRCGKTTISLHFAAKWQALGRRVVYLNAEQRLNPRDIVGVPGLKPEEFIVITSTRGRILTAQDYWDIAYTYLCEETDVLLIIDSVSVLSEERERTGGMGTETRGGNAKLLAQFCRLATPVIPVNSHVVIGIAHLYANTSGMGRKYLVAMGQKADYALSTMLYSEKTETWTAGSDEDAKQIGQINHWKVVRTPIGPPNEKAKSYQRYGIGLDEVQEIMAFAEDLSLFEVRGAWYSYPNADEPTVRAQGFEKFRQAMVDNPEAFADMRSKVMELVKS